MSAGTKFLILILIVQFACSIVFGNHKNADHCAYNSDACDPFLTRPCCERSDICQKGMTRKIFYCTEADILGRSCENDLDCYRIRNSICSKEDKCVCKANFVPHENNSSCLPLLGEHCELFEKCAPYNSICKHNRCECYAFYEENDGQCQPKFLGQSCKVDKDCRRIKYAECSENNKCTCSLEYVKKDQSTCRPFLNAFCEKSEECLTNNSSCIDNHCQCISEFAAQSYDRCLPTYVNLNCKTDKDNCKKNLFQSCLKNGICFCPPNHVALNETMCAPLLDGLCMKSEFCAIENSACIDSKCQCKPKYIARLNNRCLPTHLNGSCNYDFDCYKIWAAECLNKKCVCTNNYISFNETTCSSPIGGMCTTDEQCLVENSICIDKKCQCRPYYDSIFSNECKPVNYKYCVTNDDCTDMPHKECAQNNRCVCEPNYVEINDTPLCGPLLNGSCSKTEECLIKNSVCYLGECQCKKFYKLHFINHIDECVPISIGYPCKETYDCQTIMHAECSVDKICVCRTNYFAFNTTICAPIIDGFCSNDEECRFNNSHCLDHICQCKPNFFAVSDNQCVDKSSVVSCNQIIDCGDPWHAKCSLNHNCMCFANSTVYNRATCLPLIGGACWKDDQCIVANSLCIDYNCRCDSPKHVRVANNLCIPAT